MGAASYRVRKNCNATIACEPTALFSSWIPAFAGMMSEESGDDGREGPDVRPTPQSVTFQTVSVSQECVFARIMLSERYVVGQNTVGAVREPPGDIPPYAGARITPL